MGVCESDNRKDNYFNKVKIDGEIKDLSIDYLLEESIKLPIKSKYKLEEIKLGRGSFGQVLLGSDKEGKAYAIKIIKKRLITKGQLLANEVRIGTKLNHPNILGIKEVYEDMKNISFVMEYCEGGDLFDFIMKSPQRKLDDFNTIDSLVQILSALDYLHNEVKICHRDLKPENFLITISEQNRPILKLIDFGLASYIYKDEKMKGKIGTTMYMAPEILKNEPYDEKIDIWSAGVVLFNMMTGCEPFAQGNEDFKKYQILNKPINFEVIKNVDLRELCKEMMERDPRKRIDAATALEKAIIIKRKIFNEI
jgi:calcium-dependent protein kinase